MKNKIDTKKVATLVLSLALLALVSPVSASPTAAAISTRSFTNSTLGSDPQTLSHNSSMITVDLSAIQGATVYRATLDPYKTPSQSRQRYDIRDAQGNTLQLRAPRYLTFDATAAVQAAVNSGQLTLTIHDAGQGFGNTISLDVLCDRSEPAAIQQVTGAQARFKDGDTMVTFQEVNPPHTSPTWTIGGYNQADSANDNDKSPKTRYRIYRSTVPFTDASVLSTAELIDEIRPLSGWNSRIYGFDPTFGGHDPRTIPTLPIDDDTLSSAGTGIYVNRAKANSPAYYYVSRTVNGAEDFSQLASASTNQVVENLGPGMTVRWKQDRIDGPWGFHFNEVDITLDYFVRWPAVPDWNVPNEAFNYRVGKPIDTAVPNPPLILSPHSWNGNYDEVRLKDDSAGWRQYDDGSLLVTANLHRYNSYTGFHQYADTLHSYDDGTIQPFHHARVLDFIFAEVFPRYNVDITRLHMVGGSMGGAAGHLWGMRSGHLFASIIAEVGNNIPAHPSLRWEFEGIGEWGPIEWNISYANLQLVRFGYPEVKPEDNYSAWDYFDNTQWLPANPSVETPYLTYSNAPNDQVIAWDAAWETVMAMIESLRPANFTWDQGGHGQGSDPLPIDIRLNHVIPAFTNNSLDGDLGDNPNTAAPAGQTNKYLRWDPQTVTDQPTLLGIDMHLDNAAPASSAITDVTPRRIQSLSHAPGDTFLWSLSEGGQLRANGSVVADNAGLMTVSGIKLETSNRRLELMPISGARLSADIHHASISAGGTVNFSVDAGQVNAGRLYVVFASASGIFPGTPLPGGETLPLNWDAFSNLVANLLNTSVFSNFAGFLDSNGQASAQLQLRSSLNVQPETTLSFAYVLIDDWSVVSNPVSIELIP